MPFTQQRVQARFLETNPLQQIESNFWIGLDHIGNQRGQALSLTSVTAAIYNSVGAPIVSGLALVIQADATQPVLQQAGYLLQTGVGKTLPLADTYRVVYSLLNSTGEIASLQQTFVLRPNPF